MVLLQSSSRNVVFIHMKQLPQSFMSKPNAYFKIVCSSHSILQKTIHFRKYFWKNFIYGLLSILALPNQCLGLPLLQTLGDQQGLKTFSTKAIIKYVDRPYLATFLMTVCTYGDDVNVTLCPILPFTIFTSL